MQPDGVSMLTVRMVADMCGVHVLTVRKWIACGVIHAVRVGPRLVRVPKSEVERIIQPMRP
jgi:excisionase family DNA binding protein